MTVAGEAGEVSGAHAVRSWWFAAALVVPGVILYVLYRRGLELQGTENIIRLIKLMLIQSAVYFAAVALVWRARDSRLLLITVLLFAALFRLSLLFSPPQLSDDIYRYVWDGRVQASGVNPYRYIPADPALAHLRDEEIYTKINRRDYARTIYPPVAQVFYFLTTRVSETVTWMKTALVLMEAVTMWALVQLLASFGMSRARVLVYGWHPLAVWEFAGSGHVDALMLAFIALALLARRRERETLAGVALACATLVKFFPVALAPALYRRWGWRMPLAFVVTIVAAYVPYLSVGAGVLGFLPSYSDEEGLSNGDRFFLLNVLRRATGMSDLPRELFLVFALTTLAALAVWALWKRERTDVDYARRAFLIAGVFTVLLSPPYAWYYVWLVPFLCFVAPALLIPFGYLTAASFVLYVSWFGDKATLMFNLNAMLYGPFAVLVAGAVIWRRFVARRRMNGPEAAKSGLV